MAKRRKLTPEEVVTQFRDQVALANKLVAASRKMVDQSRDLVDEGREAVRERRESATHGETARKRGI